ncbi:hypothetical protein DPMN_155597 [Dreissena polymorpha]|uniref:Uncharacterized protein n=1 Tax=Dreissena polymorpha TaxID=45954 RepID=A0A9D4J804_DREPO|nr:hypothetical protein DPMN_155597 [Dreissena polymorpha]
MATSATLLVPKFDGFAFHIVSVERAVFAAFATADLRYHSAQACVPWRSLQLCCKL